MPGVASPSTSAPGGAPGASSASGVVTRPAARARAASPTARAGKLNLNQASAAELEALPGIGRVTADRIVRHREQRGPFATLDDFKKARLISSTAFDRLKDLVEAP
jgi:competence protein ComEA